MYSILVNPTHAEAGALAPSPPFGGFIFSFSCDLGFFSFSLLLTPLCLCIGDRRVYLIDSVRPPPRLRGSPRARAPHPAAPAPSSLRTRPRPPCLLPSPPAPQDRAASTRRARLGAVHPAGDPTARLRFPPVESLPLCQCGKQGDRGSCGDGGPRPWREGRARYSLPGSGPNAAPLFSLSFSTSLNFEADHSAQALFGGRPCASPFCERQGQPWRRGGNQPLRVAARDRGPAGNQRARLASKMEPSQPTRAASVDACSPLAHPPAGSRGLRGAAALPKRPRASGCAPRLAVPPDLLLPRAPLLSGHTMVKQLQTPGAVSTAPAF